jgi:hypothetical protein
MLRDVFVLLICLVAAWMFLQGDTYYFAKVLNVPSHSGHSIPVRSVPTPTMQSTSTLEVVVVPSDYSVQIWSSGGGGDDGGGRMRAEANTLGTLRITHGRAIKAMAAGRLQLNVSDDESVAIAVVLESFVVLCYDRDLGLRWESHVRDHLPAGWHLDEVAVTVLHHAMLIGDRGSVVVAGRLAPDVLDTLRHVSVNGTGNATANAAHNATRSADTGFFSYYAFDGLTGRLRWKHEAGDFDDARLSPDDFVSSDMKILAQRIAQNARFNVSELAQVAHGLLPERGVAPQLGELEARAHARTLRPLLARYGVWRAPFDTRLATASISVQRRRADADDDATRSPLRNALVARHRFGLEVVHLFSGRPLLRVPLDVGRVYDDANADGRVDGVALLDVRADEIKFAHDVDARRWRRRIARAGHATVLRAWADVPPTAHMFDVPLAPSRAAAVVSTAFGAADVVFNVVRHPLRAIGAESLAETAMSTALDAADAIASASASASDGQAAEAVARSLAAHSNDAARVTALESVPCVLRPARAAPLLLALTRDGTLHAAMVRAQDAALRKWRLHSDALVAPVASFDDEHSPLASVNSVHAVVAHDAPMLLAGGAGGALLVDALGVERASVRWNASRHERCFVQPLRAPAVGGLVFAHVCAHNVALYELHRRAASALRPVVTLLIALLVALFVASLFAVDAGLAPPPRHAHATEKSDSLHYN